MPPEWLTRFFTGVPAPAGAVVALLPVYLMLMGVEKTEGFAWLATGFTLIAGFFMVLTCQRFLARMSRRKYAVTLFTSVDSLPF